MVGLYDECVEHTPRETVIAVADAGAPRTQADLIVSIGGGTVIDTAKVALVALAEGLDAHRAAGRVAPCAWAPTASRVDAACRACPAVPADRAVPTTLVGRRVQ